MFPRLRKNDRIGGFTLVELIVVISIVATLAVVGVAYGNGYKVSQYNTKRLSDIDTLKIAAESYFRANGDYPEPTGNRIYFDTNGYYAHSATGSYGVSSAVTSDLFGAEFLADVPNDPDTGNAYGYGKRKDGVAGYDFAAVDRQSDGYHAYVRGTYDASALTSLVREYNGPGFVEDGNTDRLPYNPYERKITAKISSYSGNVTINPIKSLTGELSEGDSISVPTGGYAVLNVSDGSEVRIGMATAASELKLENLSSKDSKGFLTKVRFALNSGEVWAKAPKLREDRSDRSELEIVSGNAVASVRGTVFGMAKNSLSTDITLAVGKLNLTEDGAPLVANGLVAGTMEVAEGGTPKKISIFESETVIPSVINSPEASDKLSPWETSSKSAKANLKRISRTNGIYSITLNNHLGFTELAIPSSQPGTADKQIVISGTGIVKLSFTLTDTLAVPNNDGTVSGFIRLPMRFKNDKGAVASTEVVVPATSDFELDEELIPDGWSMDCSASYAWFPRLGCQPKTLRAYAPFDKFDETALKNGDLRAYDRNGRTLKTATNVISAKDQDGRTYSSSFERNSPSSGDSLGFRKTTIGVRGVLLDKSYRDDFVGYDFSSLDLNPKGITRVQVGVQLSGLQRTIDQIESESGEPSYGSSVRRAYLWSLADGTALYYRVSPGNSLSSDHDHDNDHLDTAGGNLDRKYREYDSNAIARMLVFEDGSGSIKGTMPIPAEISTFANQKVIVETRLSPTGTA
ncbi:MAG: hypothetical protein QG650_892 [Patescibacteria group bacterium]|nr:hypothetical protein [Patescibacteria group bacterium]